MLHKNLKPMPDSYRLSVHLSMLGAGPGMIMATFSALGGVFLLLLSFCYSVSAEEYPCLFSHGSGHGLGTQTDEGFHKYSSPVWELFREVYVNKTKS